MDRRFSMNFTSANAPTTQKMPSKTAMMVNAELSLRLPKNIDVVGNRYWKHAGEREINRSYFERLSQILFLSLSEREGMGREHYEKQIRAQNSTFPATPMFVARENENGGWPDGLIMPIRTNIVPAGANEIADERLWWSDIPGGLFVLARKIFENSPRGKPHAKELMGALFEYLRILNRRGDGEDKTERLVLFTRPANYDYKLKIPMDEYWGAAKESDPNVKLHTEMGGKFVNYFYGACPGDRMANETMFMLDYSHELTNGNGNGKQ